MGIRLSKSLGFFFETVDLLGTNTRDNKHRGLALRMKCLATLCAAFICLASSARASITVLPQGSTVYGQTIAQYTASWWDWALAFTSPADPFEDTTGAYANLNQSGPVFFLAGNEGGSTSRTFNVPSDKYILVPLLVGEESQLELATAMDPTPSESEVRQAAISQADQIDQLSATLDGQVVPNLFTHRETSPDFSFVSVANNPIGDPAGNSGIAVADGYWLMLAPLSAGPHSLEFGGGISSFGYSIDASDSVVAVPEPASVGVVCLAAGAAFLRRRPVSRTRS